jgi:hypothetical protein
MKPRSEGGQIKNQEEDIMKKSAVTIGLFIILLLPFHALAASYSYYVPYYSSLSNGGQTYWTGVAVRNGSIDSTANVNAFVYDQSGTLIKTETKTLQPNGQDAFLAGAGLKKEGWVHVDSDQPLGGLCFVAMNNSPMLMFDITLISDLSNVLYVPHAAQNDTWDTFIMICNPNGKSINPSITFYDSNGNALAQNEYTIPANGSVKCPLSELVTGVSKGSVEIISTDGIAAFALYHNTKTGDYSYAGIGAMDPKAYKTYRACGTYVMTGPTSQTITWQESTFNDALRIDVGTENLTILSCTDTSMTTQPEGGDTVQWTRLSGSGNSIIGKWKAVGVDPITFIIDVRDDNAIYAHAYAPYLSISNKTIAIDGNYGDWTAAERVYVDTDGADCSNVAGRDIREVYMAKDDRFLYLRMVLNGALDPTFGYKFGEEIHLFVGSGGNIFYYIGDEVDPATPNINLPASYVHIDGSQFECKFFLLDAWKNRTMRVWCDQGTETECRDEFCLGVMP